ncbi:MAG: DUF362 domain-containing protein [Verrucomicrobiales bacterium]|jgi:uncharacterized protein (DUF362 family)|nr:DUF362 domain-containing protein [Verrucomicrobiales bacterium]
MNNSRRDFIKKGFAAGAAFSLADLSGLFTRETNAQTPAANQLLTGPDGKPYLVAVRDGDRKAMLDRAIESLGGIGAFVKAGQTVVIKPNIGWDCPPERAADTHPDIVGRLTELCLAAGAASVSVFDHTCDNWEKAYANSGIKAAVEKAGGKMVPGNDETYYRDVTISGSDKLTTLKVHQLILDSDVWFNVPVLKHHGGATMTAAIKNHMGIIWDRGFWHKNDLHQCIADFIRYRRAPDLNIIDAYSPMKRNGPRGKSVDDLIPNVKTLLASRDQVAVDAAGAKILGHAENGIDYVKIAAAANLGRCDLDHLQIERIRIS